MKYFHAWLEKHARANSHSSHQTTPRCFPKGAFGGDDLRRVSLHLRIEGSFGASARNLIKTHLHYLSGTAKYQYMLPVPRAVPVFLPLSLAESRILASVGLEPFVFENVTDFVQIDKVLSCDEAGVQFLARIPESEAHPGLANVCISMVDSFHGTLISPRHVIVNEAKVLTHLWGRGDGAPADIPVVRPLAVFEAPLSTTLRAWLPDHVMERIIEEEIENRMSV